MTSEGAIAQADTTTFNDNLCTLKTAEGIDDKKRKATPGLASVFLKLHSLPSTQLEVATAIATFQHRTVGVTTGSRSAAAAGRVRLIDIAMQRAPAWANRGFKTYKQTSAVGSFVDNLFCIAHAGSTAIWILDDLENSLIEQWKLHFGPDSKEILLSKNSPEEDTEHQGWEKLLPCQSWDT